MEAHQAQEPITPRHIQVREVTHYQFSWTEQQPGADGAFSLQLILDQGAEEYVLRPTADDTDVIKDLLHSEERVFFDTERKVLMFGVSPTS